MSTIGMFSTVEAIMINVGYLEYCGGFITVGYHEYHGDTQYHGGYHDARGGNLLLFEYPHSIEHPHGTHDIPTCIMISPTVLKLQRMVSPTVPTVLSIPHSTRDNPHGTQDIHHGTEHPHGTQNIPHISHDIAPQY